MKHEYRYNIVSGEWVVIAPGRSARPEEFAQKNKRSRRVSLKKDFFAEGNEKMTPKEVYAIRAAGTKPNTPGWSVRVVPNKYPVFENNRIKNKESRIKDDALLQNIPAVGRHEVVVTANPKKDLGKMKVSEVVEVVHAYIARHMAIAQDKDISSIVIIQNHGPSAGASISHPHSQIFGFGHFQGSLFDREISSAAQYFKENDKKILVDLRDFELKNKERMIAENDFFAAFVPYAAKFPFETWIVPKNNHSEFAAMSDIESFDYAKILQQVLGAYDQGLGDPDYNLYLRTPPVRFVSAQEEEEVAKSFLWYTAISPRLTVYGGFEYATNIIINPVAPEEAANFLKKFVK